MATKTSDDWRELEYQALQKQIIWFYDNIFNVQKFLLPIGGAFYAVPFFMNDKYNLSLWCVVSVVTSLLVLIIVQSIFWSVDSLRKITSYIKEVIEPNTSGGLNWENTFFKLATKTDRKMPSDETVMALAIFSANLAASFSICAFIELNYLPFVLSLIISILSLYYILKIAGWAQARSEMSQTIKDLMNPLEKKGD